MCWYIQLLSQRLTGRCKDLKSVLLLVEYEEIYTKNVSCKKYMISKWLEIKYLYLQIRKYAGYNTRRIKKIKMPAATEVSPSENKISFYCSQSNTQLASTAIRCVKSCAVTVLLRSPLAITCASLFHTWKECFVLINSQYFPFLVRNILKKTVQSYCHW